MFARRKGRSDFFRFSKSMLLGFGTGVSAVILSAAYTTPVDRESFIILKTTGHKDSKHD